MVYPHKWSPLQLQVKRRTGKVCQLKTDVLPLCHATSCKVRASHTMVLLSGECGQHSSLMQPTCGDHNVTLLYTNGSVFKGCQRLPLYSSRATLTFRPSSGYVYCEIGHTKDSLATVQMSMLAYWHLDTYQSLLTTHQWWKVLVLAVPRHLHQTLTKWYVACLLAVILMTLSEVLQAFSNVIFTAWCYASTVYAVVVCLSVCLSICLCVCLFQAGTIPKWLNSRSCKQGLYFCGAKDLGEIPTESPQWGCQIDYLPTVSCHISKTVK